MRAHARVLARTHHPHAPGVQAHGESVTSAVEAAVAMRLAQKEMAKHQLRPEQVDRHIEGRQKTGRRQGSMCSVKLHPWSRREVEKRVDQLVATLAAQTQGRRSSTTRAVPRKNYAEDNEEEGESEGDGGSDQEQSTTMASLRQDRYLNSFSFAINAFASVRSFSSVQEEEKCIQFTFYGVLAQTRIAAYQFEVALNAATESALQQASQMRLKGGEVGKSKCNVKSTEMVSSPSPLTQLESPRSEARIYLILIDTCSPVV